MENGDSEDENKKKEEKKDKKSQVPITPPITSNVPPAPEVEEEAVDSENDDPTGIDVLFISQYIIGNLIYHSKIHPSADSSVGGIHYTTLKSCVVLFSPIVSR